jgi:hypothetical protein
MAPGLPARFVPGQNESGDARLPAVCRKKTREENQIKDDPKKTAASGASAAH